ncbi:MAG: hypothetical protein GY937_23955 [bacterium]|nr:hypothetical protein [bacterium]
MPTAESPPVASSVGTEHDARDDGISGAWCPPADSIDRQAREAALRIMASTRLGERNRLGLLLYLEGVSARKAARAVGFADHAPLWRRAKAHRLCRVHQARRSSSKSNAAHIATLSEAHQSN